MHAFIDARRRFDFRTPAGAPALFAPESVHWRVYKNPVTLFIGGVTAVLLELAEPRVRTGVWAHTTFRTDPVARMKRTGHAAMATVYGPRGAAEALIGRVRAMHAHVHGVTPGGLAYRADDPELLDWVHATASFAILHAYHRFAHALTAAERDAFHAEGAEAAALWGAHGAPRSEADWIAIAAKMAPALERHRIVFDFLQIMRRARLAPSPLRPLQHLLVRAAIALTPAPVRDILGLDGALAPGVETVVRTLARAADLVPLADAPPAQACLRLGLRADYLYLRPVTRSAPPPDPATSRSPRICSADRSPR